MTPATRATLTEQLAVVCQTLANGDAPRQLAPHLAGANLVALAKEDGGLRPIAVGEILRRLTGNVLCEHIKGRARQQLWPLQTGCCSPLGAEATVHAVRQWCERNASVNGKVLLKLDFTNAFNSLDRGSALRAVRSRFPELERWARWTYAEPSNLRSGSHVISSQAGVQQGDPLGPLIFSLTVQTVLEELAADTSLDLHAFYSDDGFLAGPTESVARALAMLQRRRPTLGLHLNLG